jgi:hypothetical protein
LSLSGIDFGSLPHIQPPEWLQAQVLAGEKPLILHGQQGESEVAVWAFDLSQGNLTSKLAFPLLVARTVRSLTAPPVVASLMVGEPLTLEPNPRTDSIDLQYPDGQTRQMVVSQTLIIEGLTQPGVYTLVEYAGDEMVYQGNLAVNAGTPLESNLRARPMPEAKMPYLALGEAEMEPDEQAPRRDPNPFWPWLAAAALVLLSVEWVYVHWR